MNQIVTFIHILQFALENLCMSLFVAELGQKSYFLSSNDKSTNIVDLLNKEAEEGLTEVEPLYVNKILGKFQTFLPFFVVLCIEKHDWNYDLHNKDIILGVYQEYEDSTNCDRLGSSGKNLVDESSLWSISIPHPQSSGRCFTYR